MQHLRNDQVKSHIGKSLRFLLMFFLIQNYTLYFSLKSLSGHIINPSIRQLASYTIQINIEKGGFATCQHTELHFISVQ